MTLEDIKRLLVEARNQISHSEYVIIGSLSIIGLLPDDVEIPSRMLMSNDLDCYPEADPGRAFDLTASLGQGSAFELEHGYYLDPVSPKLPTLPDGWQSRLIRVELDDGIVIHCLEPNDAAISKYARGEKRDEEWIRAGLDSAILSLATIKHRFPTTSFLDDVERESAKQRLIADERWLANKRSQQRPR